MLHCQKSYELRDWHRPLELRHQVVVCHNSACSNLYVACHGFSASRLSSAHNCSAYSRLSRENAILPHYPRLIFRQSARVFKAELPQSLTVAAAASTWGRSIQINDSTRLRQGPTVQYEVYPVQGLLLLTLCLSGQRKDDKFSSILHAAAQLMLTSLPLSHLRTTILSTWH